MRRSIPAYRCLAKVAHDVGVQNANEPVRALSKGQSPSDDSPAARVRWSRTRDRDGRKKAIATTTNPSTSSTSANRADLVTCSWATKWARNITPRAISVMVRKNGGVSSATVTWHTASVEWKMEGVVVVVVVARSGAVRWR